MRTTNTFLDPLAGALAPIAQRPHNINAYAQADIYAPQDDFNREFEHELHLLWRELDADVECYHRAHEEGWFYPDTD